MGGGVATVVKDTLMEKVGMRSLGRFNKKKLKKGGTKNGSRKG